MPIPEALLEQIERGNARMEVTMHQRADYNWAFEPHQPYHRYCQALSSEPCYARRQGLQPRAPHNVPWHPSWDLWLSGDWILWLLFVVLPTIVVYAVSCLLGFW